DRTEKLNADPRSPFFGRLDPQRVGALGHSYGGAAAGEACFLDSRIKAGLNIDGSPRGARSTWRVSQPFMLLQSDRNGHPDRRADEFSGKLAQGYRVAIREIDHRGFTDEALFPLSPGARAALVGTLPGPRMIRVTSACVRGFFDTFLKDDPSPLLT